MTETQTIKNQRLIGYRLEDGIYYLVDFGTGEILDTMSGVAIMYNGDTLLRHGAFEQIKPEFDNLIRGFKALGYNTHNIGLISGKFEIDDLDKILSITGYIGRFIEKYDQTIL